MFQSKVYKPYFKSFSLASVNQCIAEETVLFLVSHAPLRPSANHHLFLSLEDICELKIQLLTTLIPTDTVLKRIFFSCVI